MSVGKASIQRAAAKNSSRENNRASCCKGSTKGSNTVCGNAYGFPGNTVKISFRQQAGRRGKACKDRRGPAGLSALIIIWVNIAFYNINSLRFFENPVA